MILNIHGFGSDGDNRKAELLRRLFGPGEVVSPSLHNDPLRDVPSLRKTAEGQTFAMAVGSSLGGYYAYLLSAEYGLPCVLINPTIVPYITMTNRIGLEGQLDACQLRYLFKLGYEHFLREDQQKIHVIVCNDDELLPHAMTTRNYFAGARSYREYDTGGHQFDDLDRIAGALREIYRLYSG